MTTQKTFKRAGSAAAWPRPARAAPPRRMLIADGDAPAAPPETFVPPVAEAKVVEATGRGWEAWFAVLDAWGATRRSHTEIARHLRDEHHVDGWYSQSLTVGYERARGLRAPGEHADGFAITASRTIVLSLAS